jgi:hypothetical protein
MRKKIFVGYADYRYMGTKVPCVLYIESDTPATANSIAGIAHQQAEKLGRDWSDKISFELPECNVLMDGDKEYHLVEFTWQSIDAFKKAMGEIFSK